MVSAAPRVASTATPISSLKYGKCHWSGASTTPSSEMNMPAVIFLTMSLQERWFRMLSSVRRRNPGELIATVQRHGQAVAGAQGDGRLGLDGGAGDEVEGEALADHGGDEGCLHEGEGG